MGNNTKQVPFSKALVNEVSCKNEITPFYIYDEKAIRENIRDFISAFSWVTDFKEYFAVYRYSVGFV